MFSSIIGANLIYIIKRKQAKITIIRRSINGTDNKSVS